MTADEVRKKYIKFFTKSPKDHKEISPAPLVPTEDPSTLFTSSGMQQLIPYLMGNKHPEGKRLVNSQLCIRVQDIDEVGNNRHTTFFEMLGNWSLGDYYKKEQLPWFWEFLTKELKLDPQKLYVSVYRGNEKIGVEKDSESVEVWKNIFEKEGIIAKVVNFAEMRGMQGGRIFYYDDNWWSRSGLPENMPVGEIGGPDSEVFYEFTQVKHDLKFGKHCHPGCDCGRFLEIGNSVFIQYKKKKDGVFEELPQKNVDFGGGFLRMIAATNDTPDVFKTDLFFPFITKLEKVSKRKYGENEILDKSFRITTEHARASIMLLREGVVPSNKLQGYVLRRLIRRSVFHSRLLGLDSYASIAKSAVEVYKAMYSDLAWDNQEYIVKALIEESSKFEKALNRGMKKLKKLLEKGGKVDGKFAFDLYQTDGFPLELTLEILAQEGRKFSKSQRKAFEKEFEKHKKLSRTASAGMFKGGLADKSEEVTKLHTTTHLLHRSLRNVLGDHVEQKGSNITAERLRFDFSHNEKLTGDELGRIENMINDQIDKDLPVSFESMTLKKALEKGASAFFGEKYREKVKVYTIGDPNGAWFSKEVCGGPHVSSTGKIGRVRIKRQEKIGAGLLRVYAVID